MSGGIAGIGQPPPSEVLGRRVTVVGGGLAGSEAAWQLASAGIPVDLLEMRPEVTTAAHRGGNLGELVCSNSLRSDNPENAVGLLKREMEAMGSLVIAAARANALPAGDALAVDREGFSEAITRVVSGHPLIRLRRVEIDSVPEGPAIVATGPLTPPALQGDLELLLGAGSLAFYDAIAPVVAADSLDHARLFRASRYGKGGGADYLNAPLDAREYSALIAALLVAEKVPLQDLDADAQFFEGCLPIEVMAGRGPRTLRFGPMKPVGLIDPRTGREPYAVVQLRQDDLAGEHWNLVGFQTRMTFAAQRQVLRLIPGLEAARFVRYGMIHRNTFICAPLHLDHELRLKARPSVRLAGQITGVEGYVESAACGLLAGLFAAAEHHGVALPRLSGWTAHGGLVRHLTERPPHRFQPANASWGLMLDPPLELPRAKAERRRMAVTHALETMAAWRAAVPWPVPCPRDLA